MTCELEGEDAERAGGIFRLPPPGRAGNRSHAIVSAGWDLPLRFAAPIYAMKRGFGFGEVAPRIFLLLRDLCAGR
jgi:hypothetical protein